jgi:O-antigen/teichoic acid export membrane protein
MLYVFNNYVWVILLATVPFASASSLLQNWTKFLVTQFFGEKEMGIVTAIGSLSTPLGCIFGFIMAPFFLDRSDGDHPESHGYDDFENYILY